MQKKSLFPIIATLFLGLITGLAIGYWSGKKQFKPAEGVILIDPSFIQYFDPIGNENAHAMSVRFRSAAGICRDGLATTSGTSTATPGVFEFSDSTAIDLVGAVDSIKREISRTSSPVPRNFRAIFGIDADGSTRLIVAGLDASNLEYTRYAKIIDGHLPCPNLCDINQSDIIMGTVIRNACR